MLKEFVWKAFEKTGNVEFYMFYREIQEKSSRICESELSIEETAVMNSLTKAMLPV